MKTVRILPVVVLAVLAPLFFGGCEPQGALFTEVPAEPIVVQVDSVQMPDGSLIAVTPEIRNIVREDRIILAGTSIAPAADAVGTVQVSGVAQTAVGALRLLPIPYADVVGVGLSGLLSICAVWLNKKKKTSERVAEASIKGIDTFRDILDQTAVGGVFDGHLKRALREQQSALRVNDAMQDLLARYRTPDKPTAITLDAELRAALVAAGLIKPAPAATA